MSRRIETGIPHEGFAEQSVRFAKLYEPDDYLGRLAKYVPAEIVGLYLATAGMVPLRSDGAPRCGALWTVFLLNFLVVPAYFWFATTRGDRKPLWSQVILATIAFPVWVFAIGGPFNCLSWYEGWIASITLCFVTVLFGFYKPPPGS